MHIQTEFLISAAAADPEVHWVGRTRGRLDIEWSRRASHSAAP